MSYPFLSPTPLSNTKQESGKSPLTPNLTEKLGLDGVSRGNSSSQDRVSRGSSPGRDGVSTGDSSHLEEPVVKSPSRQPTRSINHSRIRFTIDDNSTASMFDKFIDLIRGFEQDEGIKWNRQCLAKATQTVLRSQWRQWRFKLPGEQWEHTSTERFIEFIKAIQHIYFKNTVDSIFVEPSTRIIQVLGTGETVLTPSTGVRKLESLLGRFEEACVLQTDMSGLQASELEQIKTAFRESVRTEQRDGKSNRYMSELMNKGPGITSNIPPGTTLQMWLDAMIDRASEIESSLREGEKYNTSSRPPPHYIPVGTTSSDIGAGTTDRVRFKEGNLQALGREESYDQLDPLMENHYPTNPNQGSFFESIEIPPEAP